MTRLRLVQTNFTAGEIDPLLLGRGDLRAYENGAARLRNVVIHPTGGVTRRDGLRHVDGLDGPVRLCAFEFNTEQTYLVAIGAGRTRVYAGETEVARLDTPWSADQLGRLTWTQSADTLLVCHPDVPPQRITRHDAVTFRTADWTFPPRDTEHGTAEPWPFHRFGDVGVTLQADGTEGEVTLTASAAVFAPGHVGTLVRLQGRQVRLEAIPGTRTARGTALETLVDTEPTRDWDEQAWSPIHGWPVAVTFHQDRLAVGGSRALPNRLWLSRSADLFNFDLGEGLADQAIALPILADRVDAIRALVSGRHLQVFTSGAEWMLSGTPLSPESATLVRQSRVGSCPDRAVPPREVEGATLFCARDGRAIREFLYSDVEGAYGATDLSVLARHVVAEPVDMDYDPGRRLLHVVLADGRIATLTAYRAEQVTAWTVQETAGAVQAIAVAGGSVWCAVTRGGSWRLERFVAGLPLDAALTGSTHPPADRWSGLDHLEGRAVRILADGTDADTLVVRGGAVTLAAPATEVSIGLPFAHEVAPLPPSLLASGASALGAVVRPVRTTFRLHGTSALTLDQGAGARPVPLRRIAGGAFGAAPVAGDHDHTVRHLGWRRGVEAPVWRIVQDAPLPFTLLSVATELSVNG